MKHTRTRDVLPWLRRAHWQRVFTDTDVYPVAERTSPLGRVPKTERGCEVLARIMTWPVCAFLHSRDHNLVRDAYLTVATLDYGPKHFSLLDPRSRTLRIRVIRMGSQRFISYIDIFRRRQI